MRLSNLVNIGPKLEMLLKEAGIKDAEMLREIGSVEATYLLCQQDRDCVSKLFAIEGAIRGTRWHNIHNDDKTSLVEKLEQRIGIVVG